VDADTGNADPVPPGNDPDDWRQFRPSPFQSGNSRSPPLATRTHPDRL
jgi:hypothetical protein